MQSTCRAHANEGLWQLKGTAVLVPVRSRSARLLSPSIQPGASRQAGRLLTSHVGHGQPPVHAAKEGQDGGAVPDLQQAGVGQHLRGRGGVGWGWGAQARAAAPPRQKGRVSSRAVELRCAVYTLAVAASGLGAGWAEHVLKGAPWAQRTVGSTIRSSGRCWATTGEKAQKGSAPAGGAKPKGPRKGAVKARHNKDEAHSQEPLPAGTSRPQATAQAAREGQVKVWAPCLGAVCGEGTGRGAGP